MNATIEKIITEKTQILDYYIEGMTYYDVVGIADKDWARINKIKTDLETKLDKENATFEKLSDELSTKIAALQDTEKFDEKQLKKNEAKIEKTKATYGEKIKKIIEKINAIRFDLEGIPTKQVSIRKSDTLVRAATMKPEYMKFLTEKRETIKAKYGIN